MREKVYRAGVIPFYVTDDQKIEMMFMVPSNSFKKWGSILPQIAKGKVEPGENVKVAAFREAREELGLFAGNVNTILDLGVVLGRTTVYLAEIKDQELFGDPTDTETEQVMWMTVDQFKEIGRPLHIPVVKAAYRKICEFVKLNTTKE